MKRIRQPSIRKTSYAFTLVEMLVAVTILVTAIGAPLFIAAKGIELSIFAKNRITALKLAQEGAEYIKSIRDSNVKKIVNGAVLAWDAGFGSGINCASSASGCKVDVINNTIEECSQVGEPPCENLQYVDVGAERLYGHDEPGGAIADYPNESIFRRTIFVYPVTVNEVRVDVLVEWTDKNSPRSITVSEHLYSWGSENL